MSEIAARKQAHLDICLQQDVETGNTRLDEIHLVHKTFCELALSQIDTSTSFLHYKIAAPIFISCMTGGSEQGARINMHLAQVAEALKLPLGLGSIRILFEKAEVIKEFQLKRYVPSVPLLVNLGVVQLRQLKYSDIFAMLEMLQADAIVLHLNPAQELYQAQGEQDFRDLRALIRAFVAKCSIPVIVKETGYGITPQDAQELLSYGVSYVDIAGSGGTNWAKIEALRDSSVGKDNSVFQLGFPTGMLMLLLRCTPNILASGGIRSALDIAKCLVLGARAVGLALPIITHAVDSRDAVQRFLQDKIQELTRIMLLCGVSKVADMPSIAYWLGAGLKEDITSFGYALGVDVPSQC